MDADHRRQQPFEDSQDQEQPDTIPKGNVEVDGRQLVEVEPAKTPVGPEEPERNCKGNIGDEAEKPTDEWQFVDHFRVLSETR